MVQDSTPYSCCTICMADLYKWLQLIVSHKIVDDIHDMYTLRRNRSRRISSRKRGIICLASWADSPTVCFYDRLCHRMNFVLRLRIETTNFRKVVPNQELVWVSTLKVLEEFSLVSGIARTGTWRWANLCSFTYVAQSAPQSARTLLCPLAIYWCVRVAHTTMSHSATWLQYFCFKRVVCGPQTTNCGWISVYMASSSCLRHSQPVAIVNIENEGPNQQCLRN